MSNAGKPEKKKSKNSNQENVEKSTQRPSKISDKQGGKQGRSEDARTEEITVFLSYSRRDDVVLSGFIHHFKELLTEMVAAKTGMRITAFLDQQDLNWGDMWQQRLEESILGASVFIPVLSYNYLISENCRQEYIQFSVKSESMNARDLLLPVLLYDAPEIFSSSSPDDLVKDAISRQYVVLEEAILSNVGSSEWRKTMAQLSNNFIAAYRKASQQLSTPPLEMISKRGAEHKDHGKLASSESSGEDDSTNSSTPKVADLYEIGLDEVMIAVEEQTQKIKTSVEDLDSAITELATATTEVTPQQPQAISNPRALQAWGIRASKAFEIPARKILDAGEGLYSATKEFDKSLVQLRMLSDEIEGLDEQVEEMLSGFEGIGDGADALVELLETIRPAEALSVAIRNSLKPARVGLTKATDAISLLDTWNSADFADWIVD